MKAAWSTETSAPASQVTTLIGAGENKRKRLDGAVSPLAADDKMMWRAILSGVHGLSVGQSEEIISIAEVGVFDVDVADMPELSAVAPSFELARSNFLIGGLSGSLKQLFDEELEPEVQRSAEKFLKNPIDRRFTLAKRLVDADVLDLNIGVFGGKYSPIPTGGEPVDEDDIPLGIPSDSVADAVMKTYGTPDQQRQFKGIVETRGRFLASAEFLLTKLLESKDDGNSNTQARNLIGRTFVKEMIKRAENYGKLIRDKLARTVPPGGADLTLKLAKAGKPFDETSTIGQGFKIQRTPLIAFTGQLQRSNLVRDLLTIDETEMFWPNSELRRSVVTGWPGRLSDRLGAPARNWAAWAVFTNELIHMSHAQLSLGQAPILFSRGEVYNLGFAPLSMFPDTIAANAAKAEAADLTRKQTVVSYKLSRSVPYAILNYQHRIEFQNNESVILALSSTNLDKRDDVVQWLEAARARFAVNSSQVDLAVHDLQLLVRGRVISQTDLTKDVRLPGKSGVLRYGVMHAQI